MIHLVVLYGSDRLSIQWSKWIGVTRSYSSTVDDDQQQQYICIQVAQNTSESLLLGLEYSRDRNVPSLDSDENVSRSTGGRSKSFVITWR